jgi:hypothetical protein
VHRTRPGVRLRHIAASLGITERGAYGIVTAQSGSSVKQKNGRRNRYPRAATDQPRCHRTPAATQRVGRAKR